MKVFNRTHRLLPLATFVLLAALVAVSLVSPLMQVQWGGTIGGRALAAGTWTSQLSGTTNILNDIACPGASPITCFAVGASGTIQNTTNGGITPWTSQTTNITNSLNGVACLSTINCYVVGAFVQGNKIRYLVTTDGSSWTSTSTNITNSNSLNGIACPGTSPITCFAVGGGGTILNYNGSTWTIQGSGVTTNGLNGIACPGTTSPNFICFAVGASGTILKTTDGSTWTIQGSGVTTNSLKGIACLSTTSCFAVGASGTILTLASGSWTSKTVGSANLNGIACPITNNCFAVGASGIILNTTNGGTSWTSQTVGSANLNGIACLSVSACFAVGDSGTILSNNAGSVTESGGTATSGSPVTLNGSNLTPTYTLGATVSDTTGGGAGWKLTITSTTFTAGSHTLSTTASTINTAPTAACVGTCVLPTISGVSYPFTIPAATTAPTAQKYFNAASGTGMGTMTVTATVSVAIPANAFNGTYTSTLTIAVVSGP